MILYNLQRLTSGDLTITKFDDDLNVESSYKVSEVACECPQGHKPTCRHRKMLGAMLPITDTDKFFCYDSRTYHTADGTIVRRDEPAQQVQPVPSALPIDAEQFCTPPFRRRV